MNFSILAVLGHVKSSFTSINDLGKGVETPFPDKIKQ